MYRNDYRVFAGPLLPFVGGMLIGGIFAPRPNQAPYPAYPPQYYGPPPGAYPMVSPPIYGPINPNQQFNMPPNMTQNINPTYSNPYPPYPISQDIYLINEPTIRPSVHDN